MSYLDQWTIGPKTLMFLERIKYQAALLKIKKLQIAIQGGNLIRPKWMQVAKSTHISCIEYAQYYEINNIEVQEAIKNESLLIVKPGDLMFLEGVSNIKTASHRYKRYLKLLHKTSPNAKLSINEYSELKKRPIDSIIMSYLEEEADNLAKRFE